MPIDLRMVKRGDGRLLVMYTVGFEGTAGRGRIAVQRKGPFFFRGLERSGGGVGDWRDWRLGGTFLLGCPASKRFAFLILATSQLLLGPSFFSSLAL